jgi:site-specific DNA recombinase
MSDNGNGNSNGKRAVLYARCSGDDRDTDGRNLRSQLEMARAYAQAKGYVIVAEISEDDRGASGAAFELDGLNRVRQMAQAGEFDVLVPRELDRLSRNLAKQLIVEEELKRAGVQLEYVLGEYPDTPEGRLNKHIRATIAEFEREKIVERLVRGRRNKVKAGHVIVSRMAPYGYRVGEAEGKTALAIQESEAQIVRLIFTWYVCGDGENRPISLSAIAERLRGVPTYSDLRGTTRKRSQGVWAATVVRRMLKNETYAGVWHYGKKRVHNGHRVHNPPDQWLAVGVPPLVSREVWEAAQTRLATNKKDSMRNLKRSYLLSKRVTCGECGLKMAGTPIHTNRDDGRHYLYLYYRCPATRGKSYANECHLPLFSATEVDAVVWQWVKSFLTDPKALNCGLDEYRAARERENAPLRERLQVVSDLLDQNREQLARLLDLYLSGEFTKELLTDRKVRLETTIGALERERAGLTEVLEARTPTPAQIQAVQNFAARAAKGLVRAEDDISERRALIQDLDVQATLAVEDGQKVVYAQRLLGEQRLFVVSPTTLSEFEQEA